MVLNKKSLLAAVKLKTERVELEGGEVIVSEITATDYMSTFEDPTVKDDKGEVDGHKFTALLIARCLVDEKGQRILADEDATTLLNGSTAVFSKLGKAVKKLNGLEKTEGGN